MLRVAQVGLGMRGKQWAQVVRENAGTQAVAYVDLNLNAVKQWVQEGGGEETACFGDLAEALDTTTPDVLLVATPPEGHYEQIMLALERGIPVLAEKPLTEELAKAVGLVQEAERRNLQLMVGMNFRYVPSHQMIKRILSERQLGEPSFAQFTYLRHREGRRPDLNKYALASKQIMLMEQSIHHLDVMRYCYDREVEWVAADAWNPPWSVYQDDGNASVLLRFGGGLHVNYIGTYTAGWNAFDFRWRTDCSGGVLIQKDQFGGLYAARFSPELAFSGRLFQAAAAAEPLEAVEVRPVEPDIDDTRGLLAEFIAAVSEGRPVACSGKDHLKTLVLVRACIEAAKSGQGIHMAEFYAQQGIPQLYR